MPDIMSINWKNILDGENEEVQWQILRGKMSEPVCQKHQFMLKGKRIEQEKVVLL